MRWCSSPTLRLPHETVKRCMSFFVYWHGWAVGLTIKTASITKIKCACIINMGRNITRTYKIYIQHGNAKLLQADRQKHKVNARLFEVAALHRRLEHHIFWSHSLQRHNYHHHHKHHSQNQLWDLELHKML